MNLRRKTKEAIKTKGKKFLSGEYKVASKLNRVGVAAHNVSNNFVRDFNSDGGPSISIVSEASNPFRMGNTAEVLPALQRNQSRQHPRHRHKPQKRKPRKVVYY